MGSEKNAHVVLRIRQSQKLVFEKTPQFHIRSSAVLQTFSGLFQGNIRMYTLLRIFYTFS